MTIERKLFDTPIVNQLKILKKGKEA